MAFDWVDISLNIDPFQRFVVFACMSGSRNVNDFSNQPHELTDK